ncbi:MAG: ATP-binding protein [Oscillospiraceae bacterium]|nr:ATP-binding protein [Oscillospiraceae bacterium]
MSSTINKIGLFEKPTHLIKSENNENDVKYVTSRDDLQMHVEKLCMSLKHPVVMFSLYNGENNDKIVRLVSCVSSFFNHYCCESFRICGGKEHCEKCDEDHAKLFRSKDGIPIKVSEIENRVNDNIREYMENYSEEKKPIYYNDYYDVNMFKPVFHLANNSSEGGYLEYYCPILGYKELVFPIIVSDRVLGVVFRGQVQIKGDKKPSIIRNNFLNKKCNLFDDYFKRNSKSGTKSRNIIGTKEELIKDLRTGEDKYKSNIPKYPIDKDKLSEFFDEGWARYKFDDIWGKKFFNAEIKKINIEINKINKELSERMRENKKRYITNVFKSTTKEFYEKVMNSQVTPAKKSNIKPYWKFVKKSFEKIVEKLDLHNIQIYGASIPHADTEKNNALEIEVFAGNEKHAKPKHFDLYESDKDSKSPFLSNVSLEIGNVKSNEDLKNRIKDSEKRTYKGNSDIIYYLVKNNLPHSSVLAIEYFEDGEEDIEISEIQIIKRDIISEIHLFSIIVFYISSYQLNHLLQLNTVKILRFFNHEISHVLLGFNFLNEMYIKNKLENLINLKPKELEDVQMNFKSTEDLMKSISNNIKLLTKPIDEIKEKLGIEEIRIFKDILYKWEHLYHYQIEEKNLKIHVPPIYENKDLPLIKSDRRLLEQIIINIIHNAIKYSYWGTRIIIDCKPFDKNPLKQILSVADYGADIDSGALPYKLYYRKTNISLNIEGSGIGLFVVKRIADILDIQIRHTRKKISDYNIGLIEEFLNRNISNGLQDILLNEKSKIEKKYKLSDILSDAKPTEDNCLSNNEINEMIKMPTYKVTFEVII